MEKHLTDLIKKLNAKISARKLEYLLVILAGVFFFVTLFSADLVRPYNSDDVTTQTVVQSWRAGEPLDAVVGQDTYILKIPFFLFQDFIQPHNTRDKLFESVLVFNLILFIGLIIFVHYILVRNQKRSKSALLLIYLPVIWFLTLVVVPNNGNRDVLFMNPDLRNAELGMVLILITYFINRLRVGKERLALNWQRIVGQAILFIFLAFFLVDDPYFIYTLAVPALILLIVLWFKDKLSTKRTLIDGGYIVASIVVSLGVSRLIKHLGISTFNYTQQQFINFGHVFSAIGNTIVSELIQFSANISNLSIKFNTLPQIINFAFLILSLAATCQLLRVFKSKQDKNRYLLLLLIFLTNTLVFTFSSINNSNNNRFMLMAVVAQVLLLSLYGAGFINHKLRISMILFYTLGVLMNFGFNVSDIYSHFANHTPSANQENYQIIEAIEKQGFTKGYATYWDSIINTYLSSNKVHVLPVSCAHNGLKKLDWVVNKPAFNIPATKSFYLSANNDFCRPAAAALHPYEAVPIGSNYTLYLFNRDIGKDMQSTYL